MFGPKPWVPLLPILLSWLLSGCGDNSPQPVKGEVAPAFALERLDGGSLRLHADIGNNIVAILFWADWCPLCVTEMRAVEPIYTKYKQAGFKILAINVRQDRPAVAAFADKLDISYPVLLDPDGMAARRYGVIGLPASYILDRQGRLYSRIIGELTPETLERAIGELL